MLYGVVDADGHPWASILEGEPGFAHSPEPGLLQFRSLPAVDDPAQVSDGSAIGLLGIELHTRRRNRINGHVRAMSTGGFAVTVDQSFGNCPQYIQLRQFRSVPLADPSTRAAEHFNELDDAA
jgi:predicted pyridoxine 5'-phosphate oxidase superfamily flavin-nucleotide-binding protein